MSTASVVSTEQKTFQLYAQLHAVVDLGNGAPRHSCVLLSVGSNADCQHFGPIRSMNQDDVSLWEARPLSELTRAHASLSADPSWLDPVGV